jgi:serine/threonine protein kinase
VLDADAKICVCGGLVRRAPVPHVLDDRLRFVQRVGAGGMGVVYRAIDLRLQQVRAVKTLAGTDPAMVARLRREARAMAVATHVNLATLYGLEIWRGSPMLVMEFLDGGTLANRLRRGPLPVEETLALGAMLAQAVGVLHATGTLHRDIKPSNIGFTVDGVPKLLDFGLAKLLTRPVPPTGGHATDDSTHSMSYSTEVGGIRGTPSYLSPDVLSGAHPSPADDLWSLAVTLLEACTGANPFRAASVAATVARVMTDTDSAARAAADLPDPVRRLFADLLGPRDRRPDTAYELVRRLKQERAAG